MFLIYQLDNILIHIYFLMKLYHQVEGKDIYTISIFIKDFSESLSDKGAATQVVREE